MGYNVVTFKHYPSEDEHFAVLHSATETMFSETFGPEEELEAYIFASFYQSLASFYQSHQTIPNLFSAFQQREISKQIREWLDAVAPHPARQAGIGRTGFRDRDTVIYSERDLPQAWIDILDPPDDDDAEDVCVTLARDAISDPRVTLDELVEKFRNGDRAVDFVIDEFTTWWKAHDAPAKV